MMARPKVKLNSRGVVELLASQGVGDMLERRMRRVEAAVEPAHIFRTVHKDRVVVQVISDKKNALYEESRSGDLARAFDNAGGA